MTNKEKLMDEIEHLPEPLLEEILDFVHFLKTKTVTEGIQTDVASESSLKKDWLVKEEDEAWENL